MVHTPRTDSTSVHTGNATYSGTHSGGQLSIGPIGGAHKASPNIT